MIDTHYLRALLLSTVTFAGVVIVFVLVIDPYSLLSENPFLWRHAPRLEDPWRDGRAERLALLLRQPRTIVLGSSRVVLGFDVQRLRATRYWPAYNASTYNSSLAHRLSLLRYAALVDRSLTHVLIEISLLDVIHAPDFWRLEPFESTMGRISAEAFPLIFSEAAVRDAARVMWAGIRNNVATCPAPCGPPRLRRTGTHRMGLRTLHESALVSYRMFPPHAIVDSTWKSTLDALISTCHEYNLDCTLFLSPMNASILYGYYRFKQWPEIESMIAHLAATGSTYDFLWFNHLTDEAIDVDISEWVDSIHYSTVIGDAIMDVIAARTSGALEYGKTLSTRLQPETLNSTLAQLRAQRDEWVARHPQIAWSYESLLANLEDPVASSAVSVSGGALHIAVNGRKWVVEQSGRTGGEISGHQFRPANREGDLSGWAADVRRGVAAERVAIVYRDSVLTWGRPWVDMSDERRLGSALARSGFQFVYHLSMNEVPGSRLRIFALFSDGSALELGPSQPELVW